MFHSSLPLSKPSSDCWRSTKCPSLHQSQLKLRRESKEASDSPPTTAKETKTAKTAKVGTKAVSKKGASKKGKEAEEDFGPPLTKGPTMQQRQKDEQNFKVSFVWLCMYRCLQD